MAREKLSDRSSDFDLVLFQNELDKLTQTVHNLYTELAQLKTRVTGNLADQLAELKQHVEQLENVMRKQGF